MNNVVILLTLIPWGLYYIFLTKGNLIKLKDKHYLLFNFNIGELIPLKNMLLFVIFVMISVVYKESNQIYLVNSLLFSTINLFLFICSYYDYLDYDFDLSIKDMLSVIVHAIIVVMVIIVSLSINSVLVVYNILFILSITNVIILYVLNKIISIVRRINNEIK